MVPVRQSPQRSIGVSAHSPRWNDGSYQGIEGSYQGIALAMPQTLRYKSAFRR